MTFVGERGGWGKEKEPRPWWEKSRDELVEEKDVAVEGRWNFQITSELVVEEVLELGEWS